MLNKELQMEQNEVTTVENVVEGTGVTVNQLQENVRAEDEERAKLRNCIIYAVAKVTNYIHRNYDDIKMNQSELTQFDLAVLFVASDFYSSNGGGRNNATSKETGINAILDDLRYPAVGAEVVDG